MEKCFFILAISMLAGILGTSAEVSGVPFDGFHAAAIMGTAEGPRLMPLARIYLAAGITDKDEEATIGDPGEKSKF